MATWPGSIPQKPGSGGWRGGPQNNQVAFSPDVGDDIVRRRGSAVAFTYEAQFVGFSLTDLNTFYTFFHTTLVDGTDSFTWIDPVYADSSTWRIQGMYQIAEIGPDLFNITMTMVRLPG